MLSFLRLELNLANVAIVVGHQSLGTCAADKSGAVSSLMCCQRLEKKANRGTRRECERCLSWLDLVLSPCVNESVRWTTSKHNGGAQLLGPLTPACSETQGGWVKEEHETHSGIRDRGGPPNLQQLEKKAWIKTVICLVNFYWDLWAAAHK